MDTSSAESSTGIREDIAAAMQPIRDNIAQLRREMNARFDQLDERFDTLDRYLDSTDESLRSIDLSVSALSKWSETQDRTTEAILATQAALQRSINQLVSGSPPSNAA